MQENECEGSTITKLALKWDWLVKDKMKENRFMAECMLVILNLGTSVLPERPSPRMDDKVFADKTGLLSTVFNTDCREALGQMLDQHCDGKEGCLHPA